MALAYHKRNDLKNAEAVYKKILASDPDNADANHLFGMLLYQKGEIDSAVNFIQTSIQTNPKNAIAHNNLGVLFKNIGRIKHAIECYKKALSLMPNYAESYINLGIALSRISQYNEAIPYYNKALSLNPDSAEAHNNLGNAFYGLNQLDDAILCYKRALSLKPDYAEALNNLGNAFKKLGQFKNSISSYKRALAINPYFAEAHRHLSLIENHTEYDQNILSMEKLYNRNNISVKQKMFLGFGLGKAFEDIKQYEKAWRYFEQANSLNRESYDYSTIEETSKIAIIKQTFIKSFFSDHQNSGILDKTPIFIIGMPRSGTSLVEQILSSHPFIFGAGELDDLSLIAKKIEWMKPTKGSYEYKPCKSNTQFKSAGTEYIKRIRRFSKKAQFITDKMPNNFFHVGLIKVILPKAKVIHCVRNPMDTCLSIYKNYFSNQGHKYAYDLEELGSYYNYYLDIMDHWRRMMPGFIHEINYEELISDQEKHTRKLLEYCNLPWDESCLAYYKTDRRVSTASASQVRRPIYKDSVNLWKRYELQLEPLRKELYG
ncbi:MAG: tetratricopeptide repeat protein [Desulfobacteraceae bacterium]|nr:tetratricopeptide repeat protein [Desulfobacteraceae bacterium]